AIAARFPATGRPHHAGALALVAAVHPHPLATVPVPAALHVHEAGADDDLFIARRRRLRFDLDDRDRMDARRATDNTATREHGECKTTDDVTYLHSEPPVDWPHPRANPVPAELRRGYAAFAMGVKP